MRQITSLSDMDSKAMDFHSATGKLEYTLTNDFLFKAILQKNKKVLKALVASLIHLKMEDIISIEITNPIELGSSVRDKTFNLDIRLVLNKNTVINLEMQVLNQEFWPERSIGYLSRSFDHLKRGEDYSNTKSVIHIGFLDFELPGIPPEFYGTYKLLNVKNNAKYSDKFILSVVNLKHIDLATEEDKKYRIDKWAALFKATTWEEIKMIAGKDEYLNEASSELFKRLADLAVQEECEAREQYYKEKQYLIDLRQEIEAKKEDLAKQTKNIAKKDKTIAKKNEAIARKDEAIAKKDEAIAKKDEAIAKKNEAIAKKDEAITMKDKTIGSLTDENLRLRKLLEENNISVSF